MNRLTPLRSSLRSAAAHSPIRPIALATPDALRTTLAARSAAASAGRLRFYSESAAASEEKRLEELESAKQASDKRAGELEAQVKQLEKDIQYMRADIQTITRRSTEEKAKASEFAITSFARALLSTADVLTTALKHVKTPIPEEQAQLKQLYDGVEITHKALLNTFGQHGVKKIDSPRGSQFDPNLHEATFQVPKEVAPKKENGEHHEPGQVIEVGKEGWMIGSRVLRPAQVGVVQME